ncbi:Protein-tyrosine phosphatase, partial [Oesophagostomum dentatum]
MTEPKPRRARSRRRLRRTIEATYEEPETATGSTQVPVIPRKAPTFAFKAVGQYEGLVLYVERWKKHLDNFVETYTTLGVDGLRRQFRDELSSYRAPDDVYKYSAFQAHPDKNRYMDVVCLDDTRVRLTLNVPPCTDYIHANWIKFEGHDKVFIATQAPLDNTIEDFWRMVFQEGCPHIVNLTRVESEGKFMIYTVEVLPEGYSNSNFVKVLHMTSWPDRGLPMSGRHVLRLIRQVSGDKLDNGPIVMHCSAGIG